MAHAQLEVLGDFVGFDAGFDADLAPHADHRLDHLVILRLESARGLDRELDGLRGRISGLGEQLPGQSGIVFNLDRRIESGILRRLQRIDHRAVTAQQFVDDRFPVDRMDHRQPYVLVQHRLDVGDEDHADVGHRVRDAGQSGLLLQPVELFIRHFEREIRRTALDFRHARRRVAHQLEHDGLERGLRPPVFRKGLEADKRIALEFLHHVRAAANRLALPALRAGLGVGLPGQYVAGQESHPLEQRWLEFLHVGRNLLAIDREVADLAPDELDRIAAVGVPGALERPHHVVRRNRAAVVPESAFAHFHFDPGLVLAPAPLGEQSRLEGQVRVLVDVGIEHGFIKRLDGRVHRRRPGGRIPRWQRDVVGDGEDFARLCVGIGRDEQRMGERRGQGRGTGRLQEAAARERIHGDSPFDCDWRGASDANSPRLFL